MRILRFAVACCVFVVLSVTSALAKTNIVLVPPDLPEASKEVFIRQLAEAVATKPKEDVIQVYAARPLTLIGMIGIPAAELNSLNAARIKARLATQFAPVRDYLTKLPTASTTEPPANLMIPVALDELGRNVIASLPRRRPMCFCWAGSSTSTGAIPAGL